MVWFVAGEAPARGDGSTRSQHLSLICKLSYRITQKSAMHFANKKVLITGGSRGIGKSIAIQLAREGADIAIVGKTVEVHPKLEGTIFSAAEEIDQGLGKVIALQGDIRSEEDIFRFVGATVDQLGGIDILVNNASAINLSTSATMEPKRYDLMMDINIRGTFLVSQACIPHLKKGHNPHILNLSPPIDLNPAWFGKHLAYTMSKYGMSMIVLGLSEELRSAGIGVNALWPKTTIATAAVKNLLGGDYLIQRSRHPGIVAEAAAQILKRNSAGCTGNFFIDEDILREAGIEDFSQYAVDPSQKLMKDLFL